MLTSIRARVLSNKPSNQQLAIEEKCAERDKRFVEVKKRVSEQNAALRDEILALPFFQLREALQSGEYNAKKVLYAYSWKALEVQSRFNCLCEFLVESFDVAAELDRNFEHKFSKPPLYGIPFSVKSTFFMKGYDCCLGMARFLNDPKQDECTFVTQLRHLGAIPFVYTNVPQNLLNVTCSNPVFGLTTNPHNAERSPGASSGGESCLLAAGGTPFGIGSDLTGSLRLPAFFCGLVTLKPCQDRFLVENSLCGFGFDGLSRVAHCHGFLTRSVDEQVFLLDLVLATTHYKALIPRGSTAMPFRYDVYRYVSVDRTLRVGFFVDDGFLTPSPACQRAVTETVERLSAEGHETVVFTVPTPHHAVRCLFRSVFADDGVNASRAFRGAAVDEYTRLMPIMLKVPKVVRSAAGLLVRAFSPQAATFATAYVRSAHDASETNRQVDEYQKEFINTWRTMNLDVLLCPVFVAPATRHSYGTQMVAGLFSIGLYNMIDFPAGVVSTGQVTVQDDLDLMDEQKYPTGSNFILKSVRAAAADSAGLPLGVQVVALPFEEEKCLGAMKIIEKLWQ